MPADSQSADFLDRLQKLSPKRLALLAAELERRLAALETPAPEPIAVVGMACRMPGGADTPDAFWTLLRDGVDAIQEVPSARWDAAAVYAPDSGTPGRTNSQWGGFVSDVDSMDAEFFGISAREAIGMDPQQRLLLEVSWEALEDAAIRGDMLEGTPTGVFFGISTSDYADLLGRNGTDGLDVYSGSGVARSVSAGRLSYLLGLKGPSLAVDTACSSSAMAIHLACQSLRTNECTVALAGGVNALLSPAVTIALSQAHMLSGDGRCKTFSGRADGFVRSEGCGVVVLKRLAEAQAGGDRILGVLRGSATNHDGRSSGLTAPNGPAQAAVIRAALEQAQVLPAEIAYLEAHGTGTVLGDAIELGALGTVFGQDERPTALLIGAAKSNIGHLEAAAGVAGLLKLLLSFEHKAIPASLHSKGPDRNQALRDLPFQIPEQTESWPAGGRRLAGLSSFGFSGSNVHLVVEEPPATPSPAVSADVVEILTFSAKSSGALRDLCARYAAFLRNRGAGLALRDLAYTLGIGRAKFPHRVAFTAASMDEAVAQLDELARDDVGGNAAYRHLPGFGAPAIAFLFTGQGSQYPGMGGELYERYSVFHAAVDHCDALVAGRLPHTFADILCGRTAPGLVNETAWTQPVLFTFEYALTALWRAWGIRPSVVLGHSLGEYVAACVAGVLSLEDALRLTVERGRLMSNLPAGGGMLAVRAGEQALAHLLPAYPDVSVAAVNGPRNVVLSGATELLARLREELAAQRIVAQQLTVSHAFHSAQMDPMLDEFERLVGTVTHHPAAMPIASNLHGSLLEEGQTLDARYWREHIRNPVRFADGLDALLRTKPAALLEIGPDPVLLGMARSAHPEIVPSTLPSLRRGSAPERTLHEALAQLFLLGAPVDWAQVWRDRPARKLALPTYPFQRQRYWIAKPAAQQPHQAVEPIHALSIDAPALLYRTDWVEEQMDASASDERSPDVEELIQVAADSLTSMSSAEPLRSVLADYARFLPGLNRLCSLYIVEAFAELRVPLQKGDSFTVQQLARRGGVLAEHHRLLNRLLTILEEDGLLSRQGDLWTAQGVPHTRAAELQAELIREFPHFSAELAFLGRASELANVLRGTRNAVEVLFPGGSVQLAEQVYQESPASIVWNRALAGAVRAAAERLPAGRSLKIVEIGAGTGSATSEILPLLADLPVEYIFTDISPAFFPAARAKFAAYTFVRYAPFNLETPVDSGSELAGADIVIAANVVHATANLAHSLNVLRALMRPRATLLLLEGTAVQRFGDLTVGMTEGWWRFADVHRRPAYPLLNREGWLSLFDEAGFRSAAVPEGSRATELTANQSIFVATPVVDEGRLSSPVGLLSQSMRSEALANVFVSSGLPAPVLGAYTMDIGPRQTLPALLQQLGPEAPLLLQMPSPATTCGVPQGALAAATFALEALQTLLAIEPNSLRPLWFLSHGALPVDSASVHLSGSVLGGLLKTAQVEHPGLSLRHVDLPAEPEEADWRAVVRLVQHGTPEFTMALRGARRIVPRVLPSTTSKGVQSPPPRLEPTAAYLVTGAFGGLGFRTVEWMVDHGARCVFLAGRRAASPELQERMRGLRAKGVQLIECLTDVSDPVAVDALFGRMAAHGVALRGVIHAAGIVDDATLLQQTQGKLASVFGAKVTGAYLLHRATRTLLLDFFVLYGSAASLLGSAGQSNHAAANSFLDALSELRQREGLPSTTIGWGAWAEIGAATQVKAIHRTSRDGFGVISVEEGLALLEQALQSGRPELAALRIDWQRTLAPGQPRARWPAFSALRPTQEQAAAAVREPSRPLQQQLEAAAAEDRLEVLKEYLRGCVTETLGAGAAPRDDDQSLTELGLDSLLALQLKNELQTATGVTLPASFFFEHSTIRTAATFIDAKLVAAPEAFRREAETAYEELAL